MSNVIDINRIKQIKSEDIKQSLVEDFFNEECTPRITGDRVFRIEFISKEDWDYITKIEEVDRNMPLEGAGTTMIGSTKQSEYYWEPTGVLMESGYINYFYASFKDLDVAKAKELILANELAIAWL